MIQDTQYSTSIKQPYREAEAPARGPKHRIAPNPSLIHISHNTPRTASRARGKREREKEKEKEKNRVLELRVDFNVTARAGCALEFVFAFVCTEPARPQSSQARKAALRMCKRGSTPSSAAQGRKERWARHGAGSAWTRIYLSISCAQEDASGPVGSRVREARRLEWTWKRKWRWKCR